MFRVGFEKRAAYDCDRPNARPWLYGIATNLLAHHRRSEARRLRATARLLTRHRAPDDPAEAVASRLDAVELLPHVADAVALLPDGERDALLLYVWEELSYDEIADRARRAGRYGALATQPRAAEFARTADVDRETRVSDDFDRLRELRPDRVQPDDPAEPTVFAREKERLMSTIDATHEDSAPVLKTPDIYPRLAYEDERAALDVPHPRVPARGDPRGAHRDRRVDARVAARRRRRRDDRPRERRDPSDPQPAHDSATRRCR